MAVGHTVHVVPVFGDGVLYHRIRQQAFVADHAAVGETAIQGSDSASVAVAVGRGELAAEPVVGVEILLLGQRIPGAE